MRPQRCRAPRLKSVRNPDAELEKVKMKSLAEMATTIPFEPDLDRAEEQIGQDVLLCNEEWLAEKVQELNDVQEMLDNSTPEQRATLERAVDILKRDYHLSLKVYNDPQLRETLEVIGWRWARFVQ
jgi:hypothetical protein